MMVVNSGNVIIDNTWFWRADHDILGNVEKSMNPVDFGLVVNGDNVKAYGLKSEHTLKDLVPSQLSTRSSLITESLESWL